MATGSTLTEALRAQYGADDPDLAGKLRLLLNADRTLVAGGTSTFRAASGEYATKATDSPAHEPYKARFQIESWTQRILSTSGDWLSSSALEFSVLELLNPDGVLDADFDRSVYRWKGSTVSLFGGLESWDFKFFQPLPAGRRRVIDVRREDNVVKLITVPEETRLDQPVQQNLYPGFGFGYDFNNVADTNFGVVCQLGMRNWTVSTRFKIVAGTSNQIIWDNRGTLGSSAGSVGVVCFLNSSEQLRVRLDDGSNTVLTTIGSDAEYDDGEWHTLKVVGNRTTDRVISYVDSVEKQDSSISSLTGSLSSGLALVHGKLSGGINTYDGELDELQVWYRALGEEEIEDLDQFAADGVEPGLIACWDYDEGSGTVVNNIVQGPMHRQVDFDGSLTCNMGNNADPGSGSFVLCGWGLIDSGNTGIMAGKQHSSAGAGFHAQVLAGDFVFTADDTTTTYTVTIAGTAARPFDDSTAWGWAMVVDRPNNLLRAYALDYQRGTLIVGTPTDITGAGSFGNATNFVLGARNDGTLPFTGRQSWIFYSPEVFDETAINIALSEQAVNLTDAAPSVPPTLAAAAAGAHFWSLDDAGSTAVDHIGSANGTYSKAPTYIDRDGVLTPGLGGAWIDTETGGKDIRGLPIPLALGRPQRLTPTWINSKLRKGQYSDPLYGATQEVEKVWAGGKLLTLTTDYTVDLTSSTITLVTDQTEPITMTVKGVKRAGKWLQFPGEIIEFLWEDVLSVSGVESASISAYDDLHPFTQELYLGSCDSTLLNAYNKLLAPDGAAIRTSSDQMALRTRVAPGVATPALTLYGAGIVSAEEIPVPPPTWLVRVSYDRTVVKLSAWDSSIDKEAQSEAAQGIKYVEDRRGKVKTDNPEAIIRTYDTASGRRADAALLVPRMLDLDGHEQAGWDLVLSKDQWPVDLFEEVLVAEYSRYDVAVKQYLVVATDYGLVDGKPSTTISLWRPET